MWTLHNKSMIIVSGAIWLCIGLMLLSIGTNLFIQGIALVEHTTATLHGYPLIRWGAELVGKAQIAAATLFALSTFIGYFKGRYVLAKSAKRAIARIATLPNPSPIYRIYSPGYYVLLALMIALGASIKWLGISSEVRAIVDVAVGTALISGSLDYFKEASRLAARA